MSQTSSAGASGTSGTSGTSGAPVGLVLALEASTVAGSVALLRHEPDAVVPWQCLAELPVPMGSGRADQLTPAIADLLGGAGATVAELAAIACGSGPGSFTSLRIVASIAKGLAFGSTLPVYAVPSLLLAAEELPAAANGGEWLYVSDALREERYVQGVGMDAHGLVWPIGEAGRVTVSDLDARAAGRPVRLVDGGARGLAPRASAVSRLLDWRAFGPVDVDRWEPAYGRLAEAQVKWEAAHGHSLPDG